MSVAYVDTSCLVAVAFAEPRGEEVAHVARGYRELVSANLLEAEYRAALAREEVEGGLELLEGLAWILPERRLGPELERVLAVGRLRGADLWHLASALYLAESPGDVAFLTLDEQQREVAAALGFTTPLQPGRAGAR